MPYATQLNPTNSQGSYFDMTSFLSIYGYNQTGNGYLYTKGVITSPTSFKPVSAAASMSRRGREHI